MPENGQEHLKDIVLSDIEPSLHQRRCLGAQDNGLGRPRAGAVTDIFFNQVSAVFRIRLGGQNQFTHIFHQMGRDRNLPGQGLVF